MVFVSGFGTSGAGVASRVLGFGARVARRRGQGLCVELGSRSVKVSGCRGRIGVFAWIWDGQSLGYRFEVRDSHRVVPRGISPCVMCA